VEDGMTADKNGKNKMNLTNDSADGLERLVKGLLTEIGEDPSREGLRNTPARVAEAWRFFTRGYNQDVGDLLRGGIFDAEHDGMVLVKDIDFYSMCEHHLVPFFGACHIAYLPDKKIIGLSKLARIVEVYSRRIQVQERLTRQIADAIEKHIKPRGVAVLLEARHLCMCMRGVEKHGTAVATNTLSGVFQTDPSAREALFAQLSVPK
jgi:GTP cyclohydrolase I